MKRVATNTTLLALLASVLMLLHGQSPGALETAYDEVDVDAMPLPPDAAASEGKQPAQKAADPPPANGKPLNAAPVVPSSDEISGTDAPELENPAAADDETISDTSNAADDAGPGPADHAMDSGVIQEAVTELAPIKVDGLPVDAAVTDPATGEPVMPRGRADETAGGLAAAASGNNPEDSGIAIDTLTVRPLGTAAPGIPLAEAVTEAEERTAEPLEILNGQVPPGTYQRLSWSATELFEGVPVSTPVLVVNGKMPGPTLCLTAAIHGDELNGIEMVRRVMHNLEPDELSGAVIGVPIVNVQGFRRGSRYLPDRRDLNRYFPGNPEGSQASRIAYSFFTNVVMHCDALIDLHTGSFERANLPQLRADLRNPDVVTLTQGFGATVILHSDPAEGTLRYAATNAGIPTVTLEAGGPSELELKEVMHGVKGIETLLNTLGMVNEIRLWGDPEPVYYSSSWVRANSGGILLSDVSLGSTVKRGDLLGTITDPMSNESTNLYSPYTGRIIGIAHNQVVMPGFAAFHVGIQTVEATAADTAGVAEDAALNHDFEPSNRDYIDAMSE